MEKLTKNCINHMHYFPGIVSEIGSGGLSSEREVGEKSKASSKL